MAQYCIMCDQVTNCTENCKQCIAEMKEYEEEFQCQDTQNLKQDTKPR